jgi:hypothetical protein
VHPRATSTILSGDPRSPTIDEEAPMRVWSRLSLLFAVALLAAGCSRQTGASEELIFMYESVEDPTNFNKPIATGAELEIFVHDLRDDRPATVLEARSSDPDIVAVDGSVAHLFGLEARAPGSATIEVRARDRQGTARTDSFTIRVADVERTLLEHGCHTEEPRPLFLAGTSNVFVPWSRRSSKNEPLTGYGIFPVEVVPTDAASIRDRSTAQDGVTLDLDATPTTFSLRAKHGDARLDFETVAPEAVDGIASSRNWTVVGRSTYAFFDPLVGGRELCDYDRDVLYHRIENHTPEICEVERLPDGIARIEGRAFGTCRYEVSFPRGGDDARLERTVPVGRLPGDGEGDERGLPWWLAPLLAVLAPLLLAPGLLAALGASRRGR